MADEAPAAAPAPEAPPKMEEIVTEEVITQVLAEHNPDLKLLSFESNAGSAAGDNYMSIMYAVDIKAEHKETKEPETLSIMLKTLPRNATRQQMINDMGAFEKEIKMYKQVFSDFEEFQKSQGLEDSQVFRPYPRCYTTFVNGETDFLAMENLKIKGYGMANRKIGMDTDHAVLVLENLAKFHAVSAAMFKGDFDAILAKYPELNERMFGNPEKVPPMHRAYFSHLYKSQGDQLRKAGYPEEGDKLESLYDEETYFEKIKKLVAVKTKFSVICHGDCWTNNMLFVRDESGKPLESKFLDFQLSRPASRTTDLGYFFYTSLELDIMNKDQDKLLRLYYDHFTAFAQRLGYSNDALTFEALQKEMDDFRFYGIAMGIMLAPMLGAAQEDIPDMEALEMPDDPAAADEMAKDWIKGFMKNDAVTLKMLSYVQNHVVKFQDGKVGFGEQD